MTGTEAPPHGAVLFDLDGTLVNTPDGIADTLHAVLAEHGRSVRDDEVRATIGRPLRASLAALMRLDADDDEVSRAVARYRTRFDEGVAPFAARLVYPGIPELLGRLRTRGVPLAVVTSKSTGGAVEMLDTAGLLGSFDRVVGSDRTPLAKPHPDPALLAARQLGVSPAGCLVIGDAVVDIEMATAAGMRACGVTHGVATAEHLRAAGARSVAASVSDLARLLGTDLDPQRAAS